MKKKRARRRKTYRLVHLGVLTILSLFVVGLTTYAIADTSSAQPSTMVLERSEELPEIYWLPEGADARVVHYVIDAAKKNGVDVALAMHIAENESHYRPNAVGDRDIVCRNPKSPYNGQPVHARGVWQITRCYWPQITDEQAHDPVWSTAWAMEQLRKGPKVCKALWSTCKTYSSNS